MCLLAGCDYVKVETDFAYDTKDKSLVEMKREILKSVKKYEKQTNYRVDKVYLSQHDLFEPMGNYWSINLTK
jgi:uncharacterized protein (UPF0264 family)